MTLIKHIITCLYYLFIPRSYSQLGEDLVILNHLEWLGKNIKSPGFYVDIGAFHPLDGSNTYKLYRNGDLLLDEAITNKYDLDSCNEAVDDLVNGRILGRGIIVFN